MPISHSNYPVWKKDKHKEKNEYRCDYQLNPLSPHDALKQHFTSLKTDLIFLQPWVLKWIFPCNWFTNTWQFSLLFHSHQIIFIHYKSRIATAIRGLQWMKMTMVNSGLKDLKVNMHFQASLSLFDQFWPPIFHSQLQLDIFLLTDWITG